FSPPTRCGATSRRSPDFMGQRASELSPKRRRSGVCRRSRTMRHVADRFEWSHVWRVTLCISVAGLLNACGHGSSKASESESKTQQAAKQDSKQGQVVISPAEQIAQHIEIEPVAFAKESNMLRVPGRIV